MALYEDAIQAMSDSRKKETEKANYEKFHSSIYSVLFSSILYYDYLKLL